MVHFSLMFLSEWREFPSAPCLAGKKNLDDSSRLDVCWNRARRLTCFLSASVTRKDLQFGTWTDPLFPTTLSFPSYDIGKWVGLRTYQHYLIQTTNKISISTILNWNKCSTINVSSRNVRTHLAQDWHYQFQSQETLIELQQFTLTMLVETFRNFRMNLLVWNMVLILVFHNASCIHDTLLVFPVG